MTPDLRFGYARPMRWTKEPPSFFTELANKAGCAWPHLDEARALSASTRTTLRALVAEHAPRDTSAVVFGSLARGEYTPGSDLDWTLLIDGQADEDHYIRVQRISDALARANYLEPGPTGVFGNLAFSHPILHQIGGQDDTNRNTTQRILLLLESTAISDDTAHERVLRLILSRYVNDDRGIFYGSKLVLIPRFLLNDIVRYWRTMAVDFVTKQRERADGWALRNAKLRMSRKLIFVSGLLTCFSFELFGQYTRWTDENNKLSTPLLVTALLERVRRTPLENLAETLLRPTVQPATAKQIMDAYDGFVGLLADQDKRDRLKHLRLEELGDDPVFKEVRRLGYEFQRGLFKLFFREDKRLRELIEEYGVF